MSKRSTVGERAERAAERITMKKLKATMIVARASGDEHRDTVFIELEDASSGVAFAEITMSTAQFGDVVTGRHDVKCDVVLRGLDRVGMEREVKRELVPTGGIDLLAKPEDREPVARQAFAALEVDGWRGRADDLFNRHNRRGECAEVVFVRYVAPASP